jgi:hypothetical protein
MFTDESKSQGYLSLDNYSDLLRPEPGFGCFSEGTAILLESGVEKPIEAIEPVSLGTIDNYDALLTVEGSRAFPISVVSGSRSEPHVYVSAKCIGKLAEGISLQVQVSVNHTFLTAANKIVQAQYLTTGTRLRTRYGIAVVEKSHYIPNNGLVWNVFMASEGFSRLVLAKIINSGQPLHAFLANSSLGLSSLNHLLYGNGFLTGDLSIQLQVGEALSAGIDFMQFNALNP